MQWPIHFTDLYRMIERGKMFKLYSFIIMLFSLFMSWIYVYDLKGGMRFSGLIVKKESVLRKFLLRKNNRDYPLEIVKVIPWVINVIAFCIVLLIYAAYGVLCLLSKGQMLGAILESPIATLIGAVWYVLLMLYIGFINAV